jgi:hypothetical protein
MQLRTTTGTNSTLVRRLALLAARVVSDRYATDELPVYGMVGQMLAPDAASKSAPKPFLYTHKTFSIAYNKDQIIELNLTSDAPV